MRINILADFNWETKIDKVLDRFSEIGFRQYFAIKDYGNSIEGITIVLICQNPELKLKQRIRFSKKEKKLYIDIMLDFNKFIEINQTERKKIVTEKIMKEVPEIVSNYNFKEFNLYQFEQDLRDLLKNF